MTDIQLIQGVRHGLHLIEDLLECDDRIPCTGCPFNTAPGCLLFGEYALVSPMQFELLQLVHPEFLI